MANQHYNSDSFLPVFIDASGEAYYQRSLVTRQLGIDIRYIRPDSSNRLATPEEIPILKKLGMKISQSQGVRLIKAAAVHDFLKRRMGKCSIKKKCSPSKKKFLQSKGYGTSPATQKKMNIYRSANLPVKDKEAPFSIIQLICQALLNSVKEGLTTREITNWISETQPYQHLPNKLPSKVGHALSESQFFEHSLGHPCQWHIVDEYEARLREIAFIPKIDVHQLSNLSVNRIVEINKPPFSIVKLVGQALLDSQNNVLTLREIIAWIEKKYPYYESVECFYSRVATRLCTSEFFEKQPGPARLWSIVGKYEALVRKIAYLPDTGNKVRRLRVDRRQIRATSTTTEELSEPLRTIFVDETSETIEESQDEVQILTENSSDDECIVTYLKNDNATQKIAEPEYRPVQAKSSSSTIAVEQRQLRPVNRMVEIEKPPFSTVKLVGQALLDSQNGVLTKREIEAWIKETYPYYESVEYSSNVANALSHSKFFKTSHRLWSIVDKYEASLRKFAYLPKTGKRVEMPCVDGRQVRAMSTTAEGLLQPDTIFIDGASETTKDSSDEVQILTRSLLKDKCIATNSKNDIAIQTIAEQECRPVQAENSIFSIAMEQKQPCTAMTVIGASTSSKIKPEILDVINLVVDKPIDPTRNLDCNVNPIAFPTLIETIDLTDGEIELQCPICDAQFGTKEALADHVVTHRKAQPNKGATNSASEALRNMASSMFGNDGESVQKMTSSLFDNNRESPIFVFSGNVYFTTPNTPTTS